MSKDRLIEVLGVQSESYNQWRMFAYIIRHLYSLDTSVDFYVHSGNIYVTKGQADLYPCVVAHMDTVHDIVEDLTVLDVDGLLTGFNRVTMKQTGIGGDDKVGIYIALETLDKFKNVKVAFFRDEEVGCVGSGLADIPFFDDVSMVIQCDRRGNSDFVHTASGTKMASKAFIKNVGGLLKKHKYSVQSGMMTDVMELKHKGLKVSACNLSCGYYRPHQEDEYVDVDDVNKCKALVFDMISTMGGTKWEHTPEPRSYAKPWYTGTYSSKDDWWKTAKSDIYNYLDPYYYKNTNYRWDVNRQQYVFKTLGDKEWDKLSSSLDNKYTFDEDEIYDDEATCDSCLERTRVHYVTEVNMLLCDGCSAVLKS
jgi:tripeptide aminopeptidase